MTDREAQAIEALHEIEQAIQVVRHAIARDELDRAAKAFEKIRKSAKTGRDWLK